MKITKAKKRDRRIKRIRYGVGRGGKTLLAYLKDLTK